MYTILCKQVPTYIAATFYIFMFFNQSHRGKVHNHPIHSKASTNWRRLGCCLAAFDKII